MASHHLLGSARSPGVVARTAADSVAVLLVVVAAFAALAFAIRSDQQANALARHSQEVLVSAAALERTVVDLETGVRGYALTGDRSFLQPYRRGVRTLDTRSGRLVQLVSGNESQGRRLAAIDRSIRSYIRYAQPLTSDPGAARSRASARQGKARVDALRGSFERFAAAERSVSAARDRHARSLDDRARLLAGLLLLLVLVVLVLRSVLYYRHVAAPVRELGRSAERIATGNFATRATVRGVPELSRLARAFNAMADSLQANLDELASQNGELEGQQDELARTLEELALEKQRLEELFVFGELIAGEVELEQLPQTILDEIADFAGAEAGALAVEIGDGEPGFAPVATRAVDISVLERVVPGVGLAGRAVAERRMVKATHDAGLAIRLFGRDVRLREEYHLPLVHGDRVIGVLTLGRVGSTPLTPAMLAAVRHLASQAAVALRTALSLRASKAQAALLRAVLDATRDCIRMTDAAGRLVFENRASAELAAEIGIEGENLGLYELADLAAARTADPAAFSALYERIAADPAYEGVDEYTVAASGRSLVRYTAPVGGEDGRPIGRIVALREVTGEREAERAKDEFVQLVSHELRTPLTSIVGYVETLLDGSAGELDDLQHRFLEIVQRNADRLLALVGDLLFVGKLSSGALELERQPVDLAALAWQSVEAARPLAEERSIELGLVSAPVPVLRGDVRRLGQTVDNLVGNALKFSEAGGHVQVRVGQVAGRVVLEVVDDGMGIPVEDQASLFDRFYRASNATHSAVQGSGLGLSIAAAVVEAHGGEIEVESVVGAGATFRIVLPVAPALEQAA